MSSSPSQIRVGRQNRKALRRRGGEPSLAPYLFIAPLVVVFAVFLIGPIVLALRNSLFAKQASGLGFDGPRGEVFSGLDNYVRALTDSGFLEGFARVGLFGVVQVPVMLLIAASLALIFDARSGRSTGLFQLGVFLPYAVPTVVAALLWGFLYQPRVSPIVEGLAGLGVDVDLLAPGTVLWSIANVSVWSYTGINMIIIYAALQTVPREIYEAARLDGASELRMALSIKVPMVAPALALTLLFSIIGTFQLFNEPQIMSTLTSNVTGDFTPNMSIYETTTLAGNPNLGSAMALILGTLTFGASVFVAVLLRGRRKVAQ